MNKKISKYSLHYKPIYAMKTRQIRMMLLILGIAVAFSATRPFYVEQNSYEAYLSGSMNLWERSVKIAVEQNEKLKNHESEFALLLAEYGLLNATMKDQNEEVFDEYIDAAFERGEYLGEIEKYTAESKAILSGLTGMKIAYSPWKGMFLGSKSSSLITDAISEDPDSPLVQQLFGNYKNFTPDTWGGDSQTAIKAYQKAITLYEENGETNNWMYLDAHAWLGIMLREEGQNEQAQQIWSKALEIEPDFGWVQFSLLPSLNQ